METNFVCHLHARRQRLDALRRRRRSRSCSTPPRWPPPWAMPIVRQSDKVSLATFDEQVLGFVPPSNSMAQVVRMTEHLDRFEPVQKTRMADCLTELCGRMKRREIVMIFSDFFTDLDALEPALQRMRYHRHEVVLFQVMHHDELAFEFDGMTKFVGLEIPDELLAQPEAFAASYLQGDRAIQRPLRRDLPAQPRRARAGRHQPRHGRGVHRLSEPPQPAEPRTMRTPGSRRPYVLPTLHRGESGRVGPTRPRRCRPTIASFPLDYSLRSTVMRTVTGPRSGHPVRSHAERGNEESLHSSSFSPLAACRPRKRTSHRPWVHGARPSRRHAFRPARPQAFFRWPTPNGCWKRSDRKAGFFQPTKKRLG